jgi:hypothetical protein
MRKLRMAVAVGLALAFCHLLSSQALQAVPAAADETAFIASLQAENETPQEAPETLPDKVFLGPCSASVNCGDGNVISCTGNSTCKAYSYLGKVTCDGQSTTCPNLCQLFLYCPCGTSSCHSTSGNCASGPGWISCNGFKVTCNKPGCPGHR